MLNNKGLADFTDFFFPDNFEKILKNSTWILPKILKPKICLTKSCYSWKSKFNRCINFNRCICKENSKSLKYLNILIKKVVLCIVCYGYVCTDDIVFKEEESTGILKISVLIKINEIYFVKYNSSM